MQAPYRKGRRKLYDAASRFKQQSIICRQQNPQQTIHYIWSRTGRLGGSVPAHGALRLTVADRTTDQDDRDVRGVVTPRQASVRQLVVDVGLSADIARRTASDREAWRALRAVALTTKQNDRKSWDDH